MFNESERSEMSAKTSRSLLPSPEPVRFLAEDGSALDPPGDGGYLLPPDDRLVEAYRRMVLGRRFDTQATALTKQGRLAVYPSSHGQDACQVGAGWSRRTATRWRSCPAASTRSKC
jgi:pyruvate dehydrogenase E1 component alpha subunit